MKKISINTTIYEVVSKHPDVKDIMVELGFKDIVKPGMLQSAGRIMTLAKGVKLKNFDWAAVEEIFKDNGYILTDEK